MQIIHDDSAVSGEPSLGMRNPHQLFLAPCFFLTLRTRGSVAEEYVIPPDNLKERMTDHRFFEFGKNIQSKLLSLSAGNGTASGRENKKYHKIYIVPEIEM